MCSGHASACIPTLFGMKHALTCVKKPLFQGQRCHYAAARAHNGFAITAARDGPMHDAQLCAGTGSSMRHDPDALCTLEPRAATCLGAFTSAQLPHRQSNPTSPPAWPKGKARSSRTGAVRLPSAARKAKGQCETKSESKSNGLKLSPTGSQHDQTRANQTSARLLAPAWRQTGTHRHPSMLTTLHSKYSITRNACQINLIYPATPALTR